MSLTLRSDVLAHAFSSTLTTGCSRPLLLILGCLRMRTGGVLAVSLSHVVADATIVEERGWRRSREQYVLLTLRWSTI